MGKTIADPGFEDLKPGEETAEQKAARAAAEAEATRDAGGETAETAKISEAERETEEQIAQKKLAWDQLPDWARREILEGRTGTKRFKAVREQLEAMGHTVDEETMQVIPPDDRTRTATTTAADQARREVETSGLRPETKEKLLSKLRMAALEEDPAAATLEVVLEAATEIANAAGTRVMGVMLNATERATLNGYKEEYRADEKTGHFFKMVEADFDKLVAQTKARYQQLDQPFYVTPELMGYLRSIALGNALPRIEEAIARGDIKRRDVAAAVATGTRLAPVATRGAEIAAGLSEADSAVIDKMARASGQDPAVLRKRVAQSYKGGG